MPEQLEKSEKEMIREIYVVLVGQSKYKQKGLIDTVEAHERYIKSNQKLMWTSSGILLTLSLFKDKIINGIANLISGS